jgi:hypothetical protein
MGTGNANSYRHGNGHVVAAVEVKELSNGEIAVCLRCCGNPATDHWHSVHTAGHTSTTAEEGLAEQADGLAVRHASHGALLTHFKELVNAGSPDKPDGLPSLRIVR